jgi:hypothetical protein
MSRYSLIKYGGAKYGASVNPNLLWALEVDWDGDGVFDGSNEAVKMINLQVYRGDDYYLSGDGKGFESKAVGFAILTVDNTDGRFDPYNSSGALYGNLRPGRLVRLWVRDGIGGTDYPIIAGVLQDIKPYGRRGEVDLILDDGWRWLSDRDVSVALQSDIYADDAITLIADAAAYPWGYELDTGPDLIKWWWATGKKAKSEIEDIANSGVGSVFVAADGKLKYYSRQHADDPIMTLHENELLKDIVIPQPWEFQRNIVKLSVKPRVIQSSQVIWTLNDTPAIQAGESITIWASYAYNNQNVPATDVITPESATDYTANDAADGEGDDKTDKVSIAFTAFAETAKIVITNNDAGTVYITLLKVRGKPINSPDTSLIIQEGTDAATYPRAMELDLPWQQNYNIGVNISEYLVDFLQSIQYFPTVLIENRPSIQFGLDLFDIVSLTLDEWGVDANFKIGKITHKFLAPTGQHVRTELKLFPVYLPPVSNYWLLGSAGYSKLGVTTYLGV